MSSKCIKNSKKFHFRQGLKGTARHINNKNIHLSDINCRFLNSNINLKSLFVLFFLSSYFVAASSCAAAGVVVGFDSPQKVNVCEPNTYAVVITAIDAAASNIAANITVPENFSYVDGSAAVACPWGVGAQEPLVADKSLIWYLAGPAGTCDHVIINEIEPNPPGNDPGCEWCELYNPTSSDIDVGGWWLVDSYYNKEVKIPAGTIISGNGYHVVYWTNGTLINSRAASISLHDTGGTEVDRSPPAIDNDNNNKCHARGPNGYDTDSDSDWRFQESTKGFSNGDLFPGESMRISFDLVPTCGAESAKRLSASVSYDYGFSSAESSPIAVLEGCLRLTKTPLLVEAPLYDTVSWVITVENIGTAPAYNVRINDSLPPGLELLSIDSPNHELEWCYDEMDVGEVKTVNVSAKVASSSDLQNAVQGSWGCNGTSQNVLASASVKIKLSFSKLSVEKTADKESLRRGEEVEYTIRICNIGDIPAYNVMVKDVFDGKVEHVSSEPPPGSDGLWHIDCIPGGTCVNITLKVRVPRPLVEFRMDHTIGGTGFVNVEEGYQTSFPPYTIKNCVAVKSDESFAFDCESIDVLGEEGSEIVTREHGSGSYGNEEEVVYLTDNRSIEMKKDLNASHFFTRLNLSDGRSLDYTSRWSSSLRARNCITGTSIEEGYRYAKDLESEGTTRLDENGSTMVTNSSFDGIGHRGYLKISSPNSTDCAHLVFDSQEDYAGSFRINERLEEGSSYVFAERSAEGIGFVEVDRRIGDSQRTHERGAGEYNAYESIDTRGSFVEKKMLADRAPVSLTVTSTTEINQSSPWSEGAWSKDGDSSFIGREIDHAEDIEISAASRGLDEMDFDARFKGWGSFTAFLRDEVDSIDELSGNFTVSRSVSFTGAPAYNEPHISIACTGQLAKNASSDEPATTDEGASSEDRDYFVNYTITITNDGNRSLGPIYLRDVFPPNAVFIDARERPKELESDHAEWALTHLPIAGDYTVHLLLNISECAGEIVNRVYVTAQSDGETISARGFSALEMGWLSCAPDEMHSSPEEMMMATLTARTDPDDPAIIWYNLTLRNQENQSMVALVTDELPEGTRFLSASPPPSEHRGGRLAWTLLDLAPGDLTTISYSALALRSGLIVNMARVDAHFIGGAGPRYLDLCAPVSIGGEEGAVANDGAIAEEECWAPGYVFNSSCPPGMGELACEVFIGEDDEKLLWEDYWN